MSDIRLKVFVVDDEVISRMTTVDLFNDPGFEIEEFDSAEACLSHMADSFDGDPDVILMDVEMPGLDGISACRKLRDGGNTQTQVIFLSSHDDLDTRMAAYDAGGNDYVVKPADPEVLQKKVEVARRFLETKREISAQASYAQQAAFSAMSSMGEMGVVLNFLRNSFYCQTPKRLSARVFEACSQYGLSALLSLRDDSGEFNFSSENLTCTQLEESILVHARKMDRIFQFRDRLVINYPGSSLVCMKLPLEDPDRIGRLRDHLAIIAEGAEARRVAMQNENRGKMQTQSLVKAVANLTSVLDETAERQQKVRMGVLDQSHQFLQNLDAAFVHLGLTPNQEDFVMTLGRDASERVSDLLGDDRDYSVRLRELLDELQDVLNKTSGTV